MRTNFFVWTFVVFAAFGCGDPANNTGGGKKATSPANDTGGGKKATRPIPAKAQIPGLVKKMADVGQEGAEAAEDLLSMGPDAAPAIAELFRKKDPAAGHWAKEVMRDRPEPSAKIVAILLKDKDVDVRSGALHGVKKAGKAFAPYANHFLPALISLLDDPDPEQRRWVVEALGSLGAAGKPALPALIKLRDDKELTASGDLQIAIEQIDRPTADKLWPK